MINLLKVMLFNSKKDESGGIKTFEVYSSPNTLASNIFKLTKLLICVMIYGSPGGTFLPITYHLLLTIYYLSLITYYLLLITYYLLLITYHIIYHPYNGGKPHCTFPVIGYGSPYLLVSSSSSSRSSRKSGGCSSSRKVVVEWS